ncbi:MAG: SRPBCC family protein [Acidimicrobiia bacterium]|nr:SRPBCC family protein [Acidimicrobiia bacterium]
MKITQEFEVARPIAVVWDFFQDVPSVAQCLPGAELTEDKGDGVFAGKISVKLGPMTAAFEGEATVTPDAAMNSGHIEGKGVDRRGGSRGQVKVDYRLVDAAGGTSVAVDADVTLSGSAAQFGRTGLINEMSSRLIGEFVTCLEAKLEATTEAEANTITAGEVSGFSLFLSSLLTRIGDFFKKLLGPRS